MAFWTKFHKNGDEVSSGYVCDECDGWNSRSTKYCPHCGVKIKATLSIPRETSVDDFIEASCWRDWINQPTQKVYDIYWNWCIKEGLEYENKVHFMRTILDRIPDLRSSPMKGKRYFREVPYK